MVVVSLKTTLVKICLHTNLRNRNYDLFEVLLLNSWFFFLPVFIFHVFFTASGIGTNL